MQNRRSGAMTAVFFLACVGRMGRGAERARAADAFTIEHVEVDATADSAAAARERAIASGQQIAFNRLLDRLTLHDQRTGLPQPSAAEIGDLVRDFAVEDEKASAVRYLASLSVRFRPDEIRALLRNAGVPFAETMSKPIVVVPLFRSNAGMALWDGTNPWLHGWQNIRPDGLVPFVTPLGDLDDTVALDAAKAQAGNAEGLSTLAWRYQAGSVIVATAEPRQQDGRALTVQLTTARYNADGSRDGAPATRTITVEGNDADAQWRNAAAGMAEGIEDAWKRANLIRFDAEHSLVTTVPLSALGDLLEVRQRLAGVSFLRSYDVLYLARDTAQFRLNFFGDERQLSIALAQNDLTLEQDATGWVLRKRGAPVRASAPSSLPQPSPQP